MNFDQLKTALLSNDSEITPKDLRAFGREDADVLASIASDYRDQSHLPVLPEWAQEQGLDHAALRAIADNYLWAAQSIDTMLAIAA